MIDAARGRLREALLERRRLDTDRLPSGRRRDPRYRHRGLGRLALRRRAPRVTPFAVAIAVLAAAILGGGWMWLRGSSLVAVRRVTITGVGGPDAARIRGALREAARGMSTLEVDGARLRRAVARFPFVTAVSISADFPHGLTIGVTEAIPVAEVRIAGGRPIVVSAGGSLLRRSAARGLPTISLSLAPDGNLLTEPGALDDVRVAAAAPYRFLPRVATLTATAAHGVVARLRDGPSIYFGPTVELAAKWAAAIAVLSDAGSRGAQYVDVTDPERPAAGAAEAPSPTTAQAPPTTAQAPPTTAQAPATTAQAPATTVAAPSSTTSTGD
jgi:cell division protein FtsQ